MDDSERVVTHKNRRLNEASSENADHGNHIYMDYNATTPLAPEVKSAMVDAMDKGWANPSSGYSFGLRAREIVKSARVQTATMLNASPDDVIFTSGGTEANNWVIHSALAYFDRHNREYDDDDDNDDEVRHPLPHVITSNFEHDAIKLPLQELEKQRKIRVSYLPPVNGQVTPAAVTSSLRRTTCLISIMLANNEIGAIQPIAEIVAAVRKTKRGTPARRIFFHTDAAQAIGKIPTDVDALRVDFLTLVGHKFYGPRIGALYVRRPFHFDDDVEAKVDGTPLAPMFRGGGQERAFRPGTENTPMIAGLGAACELVTTQLSRDYFRLDEMRKYLESQLMKKFNGSEEIVVFNSTFTREDGSKVPCLPNTCNVSFRSPGTELVTGKELLTCCGIAASVGAACHGNLSTPSSVLLAFGVTSDDAATAIRLSLGRDTQESHVLDAVERIKEAYDKLYSNRCKCNNNSPVLY